VGQCAKEKKRILLTEVPADYVRINSGLGASAPLNIIVMPVLFEGSVRAVIELASFSTFSVTHKAFLDQLPESIGLVLNTIEADTLTENLLVQSQSLAEELRSQQEELRESNADLERQARLLAEQNIEAERKNQQVEQSRLLLEEKAGELVISSKYKSEFIANMSHELRTPLNSLLLLAQQLEDNPDHNMTPTQVEYASVIHASGNDLLELLNSILDLAKVESGTVTAAMADVSIGELRTALIREFEHIAQASNLGYAIDIMPTSPPSIVTDPQRLRQILKNLLANAFKFTEHGSVHVQIGISENGWSPEVEHLAEAESVIAFAVTDSGIGIQLDQQQQIFEAFAQGDGTTARLYGGTGLGLSISRELVSLLGGELTVTSTPGMGSTFTVYLPTGVAENDHVSTAARSSAMPRPPLPDAPTSGYADGAIEGTKILVVDDDFRNIFAMSALLERGHADVTIAESGSEALAALERAPDIDIVLMDIKMPVMDGLETIAAIRALPQFARIPIVAVTGKVVPGERQRCLDAGADDYVPKPVDTPELLAALRPWLPKGGLPVPDQHAAIAALSGVRPEGSPSVAPSEIDGMRILLVDDDFRNIFAMSALLERGHAHITVAESGADAIATLQRAPDIDIVLMDIMMPVMDGYEAIHTIRTMKQFETLPIIAVTGKVIAGERQRCLDAGANDYVAKPVHPAELLAVLKSWKRTNAVSA
jgi:CheY-like chemotaxis protein